MRWPKRETGKTASFLMPSCPVNTRTSDASNASADPGFRHETPAYFGRRLALGSLASCTAGISLRFWHAVVATAKRKRHEAMVTRHSTWPGLTASRQLSHPDVSFCGRKVAERAMIGKIVAAIMTSGVAIR